MKWLLVLTLFLVGCASKLKEDCEKRDWFEYGKSMAIQGKRLSGDDFIKRCKGEGAQFSEAQIDLGFKHGRELYCHTNQAEITGKNGLVFNTTMCSDGENVALKKFYFDGVKQYCLADSGFRLGTSGGIYTKICQSKEEATFVPKYLCGRKIYLTDEQTKYNRLVDEEKSNQANLTRSHHSISVSLSRLPSPVAVKKVKWNDAKKANEEYVVSEDPFSGERDRLQRQRWEVDGWMTASNVAVTKYTEQLQLINSELAGIAGTQVCQ